MARGYGRVVHLRQLPTPCCHDAVAFGSRPVNDRPGGDFHPAEWTPSQAHECGGLPPLCEASRVEAGLPTGCYHHGLRQGCPGSSGRRATARGKWWPSRGAICGDSDSEGTIGAGNGGEKGWAVGQWMRAAGRIRVRSSGPASFGLWPGRKLCGAWTPSGATSVGPRCFRAAAQPGDPKTERRQGTSAGLVWSGFRAAFFPKLG